MRALAVLLCAPLLATGLRIAASGSAEESGRFPLASAEDLEAEEVEGVDDVGAFTSSNGALCAQSDARTIEGFLALKKAGPHGKAFFRTHAYKTTCEAMGFTLPGGEDACYPKIQLFWRREDHRGAYARFERNLLRSYGGKFSIPEETIVLLAACTCHPHSAAMRAVHGQCERLENMTGSWVHRDPQSNEGLICFEGPIQQATYSLATLKSSVQVLMHMSDQVSPLPCSEHGFKEKHEDPDQCFPRMNLWAKTKPFGKDKGIKQSQRVEYDLFVQQNYTNWAKKKGLNTEAPAGRSPPRPPPPAMAAAPSRRGRGRCRRLLLRLCAVGGGLALAPLGPAPAASLGSLRDWNLDGSVGRSGWRGGATYVHNSGCRLQLQAQGQSVGNFSELGAAVSCLPDEGLGYEVSMGFMPLAKDKLKVSAKLKQKLQEPLPALRPHFPQLGSPTSAVGVSLTQSSAAIDAQVAQPVTEDLDVSVQLKLGRSRGRQELIKTAGAEMTYKLGGGQLVGGITAQAPGGAQVTAAYRLG